MRNYNNVSWSTMGLVLCFVIGLALLWMGISTAQDLKEEYTVPIYISEDLSVSGYSSYIIKGELTNYTNNDITIDRLDIKLSGKEENTNYYTDNPITIVDINIPSNSSYHIYLDDIIYTESGVGSAHGELTSANISKCVINGEVVQLKEFDGHAFVSPGGNSWGHIVCIILGCVLLMCAILIIIYKIKNR